MIVEAWERVQNGCETAHLMSWDGKLPRTSGQALCGTTLTEVSPETIGMARELQVDLCRDCRQVRASWVRVKVITQIRRRRLLRRRPVYRS